MLMQKWNYFQNVSPFVDDGQLEIVLESTIKKKKKKKKNVTSFKKFYSWTLATPL
jgi:Zn/Cd-binding protein ZinT